MKKYLFISVMSFLCMCFVSCKEETIETETEISNNYQKKISYATKGFVLRSDQSTGLIYGAIDFQKLEEVSLNDESRDIVIWYDKKNDFIVMSPDADLFSVCFRNYVSTNKWTKFKNEGSWELISNNKNFLEFYAQKTITESEQVKAINLGVINMGYDEGTSYGTTLKPKNAAFFETKDGLKGLFVLQEILSDVVLVTLYVIYP